MNTPSFDAKTIVETRAGSLRSRAVAEVRAWTDAGLLYVHRADDIRWTPEEPFGAVQIGGQWIPQNERGLIAWAIDEGLNWRKADGSIVLWESADVVTSVAGGGGGGDEPVVRRIKCPECGSTNWRCWDERTHYFEDKATGEIYQAPVGYLACKDCHTTWLDGGGDDGDQDVTEDVNAAGGGDPDGNYKPLWKMTAAEARQYARDAQQRLQQMIDDLNLIPGVKASGTVSVTVEVIDEDEGDDA